MSAVLTRRRPSRTRDRDPLRGRQERLFGGVGAAPPEATPVESRVYREPVAPRPEAEPGGGAEPTVSPGDTPVVAGPTLEDAITGLWDALRSADVAACPVCGSAMQPRHSAAAGVVGGRCGSCETALA